MEDALITYRYATNLATGKGFVFNEGERVLGTTTPLQTMVLAAAGWLLGPARIPQLSTLLMLGAGIVTGALNVLILKRLGFGRLTALAGGALYFASREMLLAAAGGMETSLALMWMAASLLALLYRRPAAAFALGALLVLTRPDGGVWLALLAAGWFAGWWRNAEQPAPAGYRTRSIPTILGTWLPAALILLPWLLFATVYFGSPIPHSVTAKQAIGPWSGYPLASGEAVVAFGRWFAEVTAFRPAELIFVPWLFVLVIGAGTWLARPRARRPALLLLAYILLYGAFLYLGRAPHFPRYLAPALWATLLLAAAGLERLVRVFTARPWAVRAAVPALILLFAYTQNAGFLTYHTQFQANEHHLRRAAGLWLAQNTPAGSSVAMEAIGYQGYYSGRRVVDLAGLVTPAVVRLRERSADNAETFYRVLQTLQPDYLVLRSFEVDQNRHFHGGPLFATAEQRAHFTTHYREVRRFTAPYPALWGDQGGLTIYERVS